MATISAARSPLIISATVIDDLKGLSTALQRSAEKISNYLSENGFEILFCAADGVVASTTIEVTFSTVFNQISELAPEGITFSVGVGGNLREAYIALISAKSNGKNCLHQYSDLNSCE